MPDYIDELSVGTPDRHSSPVQVLALPTDTDHTFDVGTANRRRSPVQVLALPTDVDHTFDVGTASRRHSPVQVLALPTDVDHTCDVGTANRRRSPVQVLALPTDVDHTCDVGTASRRHSPVQVLALPTDIDHTFDVGTANRPRSHFSGVATGNTFRSSIFVRRLALSLALTCTVGLLASCSTSKDEILPPGDHTMLQLWNGEDNDGAPAQATAGARETLRRPLTTPESQTTQRTDESYSRSQASEISQQFPRLPNPDMVMYLYPHLVDGNTPVPGYSTVFPFYSRTQYAMPGERTEAL